jgi:hypothetical protein
LRKIIAVLLYLLAIVLLALAPVFGSIAFHEGGGAQAPLALLVYVLVALIPLLLGLLTEPDGRLIPAGLILLGAAGTGIALTLLLSATFGNPALMDSLVPGRSLNLSALGLLFTSLPMGVAGGILWVLGRHWREPANRPNRYRRLVPEAEAPEQPGADQAGV